MRVERANKHKEQLASKFFDTWGDERCKYWQVNGYNKGLPEIPDSDYSESHFVILDEDRIIGYVSYSIIRLTRAVYNLEIVNFTTEEQDRRIFGLGLSRILKNIFEVHGMSKLNFNVVVGNPVEKSYDKMIKRYGGRVVGVYKRDVMLLDGTLCDYKIYEILKEEYFANK